MKRSALFIAVLALLSVPASASAQGTGAQAINATVNPGTLAIAPPGAFSYSETLSGTDTLTNFPLSIGIDDDTGTGDGWTVTVVSSALETAFGITASSAWSLTVNGSGSSATSTMAPTAAANGTAMYTLPVDQGVSYPVVIPGITGGSPTPAVMYSAAAGTGMGDFTITADMWLGVPADALAGTYSATITWAVAQGPSVQVLTPATSYAGYTWNVPLTLTAAEPWYYSAPINVVVDDTPNDAGYTVDGYSASAPSSCADTIYPAWYGISWQEPTEIQAVNVYLAASPADTQTVYVCVSSNGGSTWTEAAPVTADVQPTVTEISVPMPVGSYNALRVFVADSPNWPDFWQITVQP
jgi:hypothetical protein